MVNERKYKNTHWKNFIGTLSIDWSPVWKAGCFLCPRGLRDIKVVGSNPYAVALASWLPSPPFAISKGTPRYHLRPFRKRAWLWKKWIRHLWENIFLEKRSAFQVCSGATGRQHGWWLLLLPAVFFAPRGTMCIFLSSGETASIDMNATAKYEKANQAQPENFPFRHRHSCCFFPVHAQPKWVCLKQTGDSKSHLPPSSLRVQI